MNEATPDWRTFSSRAAQPPGGAVAPVVPLAPLGRAGPSWTVVALVGGGAAAFGAAAVLSLSLLLGVGGGGGGGEAGAEAGGPLSIGPGIGLTADLPVGGSAADQAAAIVVDVAGGVAEPGLRRLRAGDRVGDAIVAAGGFAPRADLGEAASALNLAEPLIDGMKVFVPILGVTRAGASGAGGDGLVDINSADQALLETLPGVGPVTAARIMEARAEQRFTSVEDLRSRGIVGNAVFDDLRDLVRAG